MNRLDRLEIYLDNSIDGRFQAGETVHGKLIVILRRSMKIQGIEMKVRGRSHAEWREGDGDEEERLYETEEYIKQSIIVFGREVDREVPNVKFIDSGKHVFNFTFDIPKNAPSSFEGMHGYIRYWVKAKLYGVWGLLDQSGKVEFGVERSLDLNLVPGAQEPAEDEDSCVMCGCCINRGSITASFRINRRGFVPGESIICNAEVINGSDTSIKSTKLKFYKIITYGDTPFDSNTREKQTISEQFRGKVKTGKQEVYCNEALSLPASLPVTSLPGCSFIDIDYVVELKVYLSQEELNMRIPLVIIVGTIPFSDNTLTNSQQIRGIVANNDPIPEPVIFQTYSANPFTSELGVQFAPPTASAPPMTTELNQLYPKKKMTSFTEREITVDEVYGRRTKPKFVRIMSAVNEGYESDSDKIDDKNGEAEDEV